MRQRDYIAILSASELVVWLGLFGSFPRGADPRERERAMEMLGASDRIRGAVGTLAGERCDTDRQAAAKGAM